MPAQLIEASKSYTFDEIKIFLQAESASNAAEHPLLTSLTSATSLVTPGALFAALVGSKVDGHRFLEQAVQRQAAALLVQKDRLSQLTLPPGMPCLVVSDTHLALSRLAKLFSGNAADKLTFIGITGTNGKTTTTWITYHALSALGIPSLRIGTLGVAHTKGFEMEGSLTTPDPCELHGYFRDALEKGISHVVMEVSSHALAQDRVAGIPYKIGVFTNLSRDHLDYHSSMETYFEAKTKLFHTIDSEWGKEGVAIINRSDQHGRALEELLSSRAVRKFSFGYPDKNRKRCELELLGSSLEEAEGKFSYELNGTHLEIRSPLLGDHNLENIASSMGCLLALGVSPRELAPLYRAIPQVPGRLELVHAGSYKVFVDYAHSPDALERVLKTLRRSTVGKLWVLFGCGGDRDRGKRPQMAEVAAAHADRVVVTSDNPRTENPSAIIDEILSGRSGEALKREALIEVDRAKAIARMLQEASAGDVLLIAGKGHENYQIIGTTKYSFSDQEEVRKYFKEGRCH